MSSDRKTPGVYVTELNAFPNSVVAVATAIPAFIGYTPSTTYRGKSFKNVPLKITSLHEFMQYFGRRDDKGNLLVQYRPFFHITELPENQVLNAAKEVLLILGKAYCVQPDPKTIFHLYNAVRLFYDNGGATCYIVAVGEIPLSKSEESVNGKEYAEPLKNELVKVKELEEGIDTLDLEDDPTLIVIPDAVLLDKDACLSLYTKALTHCHARQSRMAILDVPGGAIDSPLSSDNKKLIDEFREGIGTNYLNYGAAYFPFLQTLVMASDEITYENVGAISKIVELDAFKSNPTLSNLLKAAQELSLSPQQIEDALLNHVPEYKRFHELMLSKANTLPPSAAMAGVYTAVDEDKGVWHAPANITLRNVSDLTARITSVQQEGLNVHAMTGKSINAIRYFPGLGVMVWGARTLDGNSNDWRYINVRRTLIMIEQSLKLAARAYVFAPNTANTWSLVKSMLEQFLTTMWTQGAIVGATPAEAFSVAVGLGSTMTAQDILDGYMRILVKVAVSHPAEFIEISIQQQFQSS